MTTKSTLAVVIFVSDIQKVSRFYRELFNMSVATEDAHHTSLRLPGFELVIHGMRGGPEPSEPSELQVREDSYMKVCLPVESIEAARQQASPLGGHIKPAKFEWESNGIRACDGHDPEGNVIQVRVESE